MTKQIGLLFPGCPEVELSAIAEHTAAKGSRRVGRTEAGWKLEQYASTAALSPLFAMITYYPRKARSSGRTHRADALCHTVFAGTITKVHALEHQVCRVPKGRRGPDLQ
jgi:hypothetical protein